jgi:hypothetical protein
MYFCTEDNRYVNAYANHPADVARRFAREGLDLAVLFPGDTLDTRAPAPPDAALAAYERSYEALAHVEYHRPRRVELSQIQAAFEKLCSDLHDRYPRALLSVLRPVRVRVPDPETTLEFSIAGGWIREVDGAAEIDLVTHSQPLHFAFANPFGVQTLGVSARFQVHRKHTNRRMHRVLFAMNNAEVYVKRLPSREGAAYFTSRLRGGVSQVVRRLRLDATG